jgi:hypothetical protein
MFVILFAFSICLLFFAVVINLSIFFSNNENSNKFHSGAIIFLIFSVFLLWITKPENKTYVLSQYASYSNLINVLSNKSSIEKNLSDEFKSICNNDSCALFEGDSKFYIDNTNLYKDIKSISIIPVYPYLNTMENRESEPFLMYRKVSIKSEDEKIILENNSKQSLFKVEFKDKKNPVYLLVQLSIIDPNGMLITFKKDKFIIHAKKPEIYITNYEEFNSIITNVINKTHAIKDDMDGEANKKVWTEKEIK